MESATKTFHNFLFIFIFFISNFIHISCTIQSTPTSIFPSEAHPTKSGYLRVSPATTRGGSAMFYAFYEAQKSTLPLSQTPLVVWLQGGPGCSSLIGNFYELGPWRVSVTSKNQNPFLKYNKGSWNRIFGLLFLDNPIGVGFSIASSPSEIPRNQSLVAKHLFWALRNFVASDPLFKSRPIYITGESYAGKYVPAIGYYILRKNSRVAVAKKVNLAGVAIGNGLTDPIVQIGTHADNAYFSGLINEKQKTQLEIAQMETTRLIKEGSWSAATDARSSFLTWLQNITGLATLYDYRRQIPYETDLVTKFLEKKEVKEALKVNTSIVWEECSDVVGEALHEDVMKSVKYMVEFLVEKTKVLLYQGQCDLRDGVVSVEAWVKTMKWDLLEDFMNAKRKVWRVNGELAGYVQKFGNLSQVVVLGAGHLVPADQAVNSQVMIEDWVLERAAFGNHTAEEELSSLRSPAL
ncbi:Peptidase S10, serine carboxypeptidase [Dillenia turbinata]|uniref:Carboxypeptidase n=1 Tax=Dillenia turbinata TaxID=194707 RepID=A0AAN8ZAJ2_9MAGN